MLSVWRTDNRRYRSQYASSFMRRFLMMLTFTAWAIPAAGCTAMRTAGTPPGPVECDPSEPASLRLMGLALGSLEGFEVYSAVSLTGAGAAPASWRGVAASRAAEVASGHSSFGRALEIAG